MSNRCAIIGGDVFTAVPADYETYLLSRVIHDWDFEFTQLIPVVAPYNIIEAVRV